MKSKKIWLLRTVAVIFILVCILGCSACVDYGHTYYFSVVGGHGTLCMQCGDGDYAQKIEESESPISMMDGRGVNIDLLFIATPDEGYQVKQWTFDGKVVEDNKTEYYRLPDSYDEVVYIPPEVYITVEFELIK